MAIAIEAQGNAMSGEQGLQTAEIAGGILGLQLKASGHDAAGSVVLKAQQSEAGAAAFQPVMAAGVGQKHHAETGPAWAAGTILRWAALLRRRTFGLAQNAAHALPAQAQTFLLDQFLPKMGVIEAGILAPDQSNTRWQRSGSKAQDLGLPQLPCRTQSAELGW